MNPRPLPILVQCFTNWAISSDIAWLHQYCKGCGFKTYSVVIYYTTTDGHLYLYLMSKKVYNSNEGLTKCQYAYTLFYMLYSARFGTPTQFQLITASHYQHILVIILCSWPKMLEIALRKFGLRELGCEWNHFVLNTCSPPPSPPGAHRPTMWLKTSLTFELQGIQTCR